MLARVTDRLYRAFISVRLAVIVILSLASALAAGTIVESLTDTPTAGYYVYRAGWFQAILVTLGFNILFVALSRLPWKKKHIPFLLAHLGILTLLTGSWITFIWGVDANLIVSEGQSSHLLEQRDSVLLIKKDTVISKIRLPWRPPSAAFRPRDYPEHGIGIKEYLAHADLVVDFAAAPADRAALARPAVHIELQVPRARLKRKIWLWAAEPQWSVMRMGPAILELISSERLARSPFAGSSSSNPSSPLIRIVFDEKKSNMRFEAWSKGRKVGHGKFEKEALIETGLGQAMGGIKVRVLDVIPKAVNASRYESARMQYGDSAPGPAIKVRSLTSSDEVWLGHDERARFVSEGNLFTDFVFQPERTMLDFGISLDRFEMTFDPGTQSPATYASTVRAAGQGPFTISMNNPLQWNRYTFYQASYIPEEPRPRTTVLSVNYDPGRYPKYAGSLLIVLGSALLFIVKYRRAPSIKKKSDDAETSTPA